MSPEERQQLLRFLEREFVQPRGFDRNRGVVQEQETWAGGLLPEDSLQPRQLDRVDPAGDFPGNVRVQADEQPLVDPSGKRDERRRTGRFAELLRKHLPQSFTVIVISGNHDQAVFPSPQQGSQQDVGLAPFVVRQVTAEHHQLGFDPCIEDVLQDVDQAIVRRHTSQTRLRVREQVQIAQLQYLRGHVDGRLNQKQQGTRGVPC
jgi:hypothetical protein